MTSEKPLIFVSCGQRFAHEKALGKEICNLIEEFEFFKTYYAENRSEPEALTVDILHNLNKAAGIIAVMHRRGRVVYFHDNVQYKEGSSSITVPKTFPIHDLSVKRIRDSSIAYEHDRASVWIEQELAIVAYMRQEFKKPTKVALFAQNGIEIEGLRAALIMNPVRFEESEEVIENLRTRLLPSWKHQLEAIASSGLELELGYETISSSSAYHEYSFTACFTNGGDNVLEDYRLDLEFPTAVLKKNDINRNIVAERSNNISTLLRFSTEKDLKKLYQGDKITNHIVRYVMNDELYMMKNILDQPVHAILYVQGKKSKILERPFREFQNF